MGLFNKKVECVACSQKILKKDAVPTKEKTFFVCQECDSLFANGCVVPKLNKEKMAKAKAEVEEKIAKYKDIFKPDLQCGKMHIDSEHGLFAIGDTYVPGVSPCFSFSDFNFSTQFKKIHRFSEDTGIERIKITQKGMTFEDDIAAKQGAFYIYGMDPREYNDRTFDVSIPITEEFVTTPNGDERGYYYDINNQYSDSLVEFIHQYLRHADEEVYDRYTTGISTYVNNGLPQFLLVQGPPCSMTQITFAELYVYVNSKFDRESKDPLEMRACRRLDVIFAFCLGYCRKRTKQWVEYKSGHSFKLEVAAHKFLERIEIMWKKLKNRNNKEKLEEALKEIIWDQDLFEYDKWREKYK